MELAEAKDAVCALDSEWVEELMARRPGVVMELDTSSIHIDTGKCHYYQFIVRYTEQIKPHCILHAFSTTAHRNDCREFMQYALDTLYIPLIRRNCTPSDVRSFLEGCIDTNGNVDVGRFRPPAL